MGISNMVLRTVYISPTVDDELRDQAFKLHTSKNDLIRKYIELGMAANKQKKPSMGATGALKPPAAKKTKLKAVAK
jgi:hypothetical protein